MGFKLRSAHRRRELTRLSLHAVQRRLQRGNAAPFGLGCQIGPGSQGEHRLLNGLQVERALNGIGGMHIDTSQKHLMESMVCRATQYAITGIERG